MQRWQPVPDPTGLQGITRDSLGHMSTFMSPRTFFRLSAVSRTLHREVLASIALDSERLSRVCTTLLRQLNWETALPALEVLSKNRNPEKPLALRLVIHAWKLDRLGKIWELFQGIHSLSVKKDPPRWPAPWVMVDAIRRREAIPPCRECALDSDLRLVEFSFKAQDMLTTLKGGRIDSDGLLSSFAPYTQLEYLDSRLVGKVTVVSDAPNGIDGWIDSRSDQRRSFAVLKKCVEFSPQFIPAVVELAS